MKVLLLRNIFDTNEDNLYKDTDIRYKMRPQKKKKYIYICIKELNHLIGEDTDIWLIIVVFDVNS